MRKLAVLFLTTLLVAGCGSSSDDAVTAPPTACSNDGQKQFVLDALYDLSLIHISEPTRPMKESRVPAYA